MSHIVEKTIKEQVKISTSYTRNIELIILINLKLLQINEKMENKQQLCK